MKFWFIIFFAAANLNIFSQSGNPEWSEGIIWYQIFPERFANGDSTNDPDFLKVSGKDTNYINWKVKSWTSDWFSEDEWEKRLPGKFRDKLSRRRYGGDIQGIIDHLDYLKELGVDAIYINPVFEAVSLHKYDASYYHHIDFNFGPHPSVDRKLAESEIPDDSTTWNWTSSDKLFLKLIREVHKREMYIIIDGVFNHTGREFWAFKDIIKNGKQSRYSDWYIIQKFDDPLTKENEFDYKGWWNSKSLPEFSRTENDLSEGPKNYIFNSTVRWMDPNNDGNPEDGIDGWRLDVARDVPIGFWKQWSRLVKSINPNAYLTGELWELAPEFVGKGDVFDALMNYNFAFAVNSFLIAQRNKISANEFSQQLQQIFDTYPENICHSLMNLLDSHDTDRLASMILNPDRNYDHDASDDNANYNPGKPSQRDFEIQKLIVAFQMTWLGAPMIYYGDEAGMWGADDPHDRKPMIWKNLKYDDENINALSGFKKGWGKYKVEVIEDLLQYYQKIIAIRKNHPALIKGTAKFLLTENDKLFAFRRDYISDAQSETCLVYFNLNDSEMNVTIPARRTGSRPGPSPACCTGGRSA